MLLNLGLVQIERDKVREGGGERERWVPHWLQQLHRRRWFGHARAERGHQTDQRLHCKAGEWKQ